MFFAITGITNSTLDIILGVLFVLTTLIILGCSIFYIIKHSNNEKTSSLKKTLIIILVLAFLIRVLFSLVVIGHRRELFETIYATLKDPDYFVDPTEPPSTRLYPLTYYLISFFASPFLSNDASYDSVVANLFIKMPFILADVITAYLTFKVGQKFANEHFGIALCAIVAFCPIFFFASSLWGSIICLLLPVFLGVFLCIAEKKFVLSIFLSSIALIIAKEGMIIFPVVLAYFVVVWIKNLIDLINKKTTDVKNLFIIPITAIVSIALIYVVSIPYTGPISGNSFADFVELFFVYPIKDNWFFGTNALSIYSVFGFNTTDAKSVLDQFSIALIFALFVAVITGCTYAVKRNRALITVFACFGVYTICTYFVGFTALSILPVLPLMLLSYALTKDKRFIISFSITAFALIVLVSTIYVNAGYYNTLPIDDFAYSDIYTGSTWLEDGASKVILIVFSVISVINHIFLTLTTFDIAINNRVLKFTPVGKPTFKYVLKQVFTNKE